MTGFGHDDSDARAVTDRFGVAIEQARRDHLISPILAALSASHARPAGLLRRYGSRAHLPADGGVIRRLEDGHVA